MTDHSFNTCVELLSQSWFAAACVRVARHADGVFFSAFQLVESAVGAAGVAGDDPSSHVHRGHHLGLVWA